MDRVGPGVVTLDASAIRFSQTNVKSSLPDISASMQANGWQGAPIDVVRMADGSLTAADNTRLAAACLSRTPVQAVIRNFDDAFPASRAGGNLQGATLGEAILNRIGRQKPSWQSLYPNGSPFTGVHPSTPGFTQ
jgi:filamentous hemagglutinin